MDEETMETLNLSNYDFTTPNDLFLDIAEESKKTLLNMKITIDEILFEKEFN